MNIYICTYINNFGERCEAYTIQLSLETAIQHFKKHLNKVAREIVETKEERKA